MGREGDEEVEVKGKKRREEGMEKLEWARRQREDERRESKQSHASIYLSLI